MRVSQMWADMARRKVQFHSKEDWKTIRLWGLMMWGDARPYLEKGLLLTDMKKENHTIWVRPSEEAYHKFIEPLLDKPLTELLSLAGWE